MELNEVIKLMDIVSGIIISVASPIILGFIYFIARMIKKDRSAHQKLTNALIAIQKNHFVQIYYDAKAKGGIMLYERDMLIEMHKSYKELGGNTYIDTIMDEIRDMPTLD